MKVLPAKGFFGKHYHPYGMVLPGRKYSAGSQYRYGFNGKEDDKDISEGGQDYGMRINDTRLGRFLSVDPVWSGYPMLTPYQFASDNPIFNIDIDGLEGGRATLPANIVNGKTGELFARTQLEVSGKWDIYEQVTVRPTGTGAASNTRMDFLLRSRETGNLYRVEVKTGDAVSSENQTASETAIQEGEYMELRSAKPEIKSDIGAKGIKLRIGGSIRIRLQLNFTKPNFGIKAEGTMVNPNVKGASEIATLEQEINSFQAKLIDETPIVAPTNAPEITPVEEIAPEAAPIDEMTPFEGNVLEPVEFLITGINKLIEKNKPSGAARAKPLPAILKNIEQNKVKPELSPKTKIQPTKAKKHG
ncbi:MAG: RHS repeat-associated core domain-containing protein [Chitinophagaceae bacterium]